MTMPAPRAALVGAVLLVLLAGCSSAPRPDLRTPSSQQQAAPPTEERYGAPDISRPRRLSVSPTRPCDLLDSRLRTRLGYDDSVRQRTVIGRAEACNWSSSTPRRTLSIVVWVGEDYFVDTYRARLLPIFEPLEIGSLPAVEQRSRPRSTFCTTTVGVAPRQALDLTVAIDELENGLPVIDACAEGRRVAEAVVATLPPA